MRREMWERDGRGTGQSRHQKRGGTNLNPASLQAGSAHRANSIFHSMQSACSRFLVRGLGRARCDACSFDRSRRGTRRNRMRQLLFY